MNTVDWIYVTLAGILWGIIIGYWARGWLPTADDLTDRYPSQRTPRPR